MYVKKIVNVLLFSLLSVAAFSAYSQSDDEAELSVDVSPEFERQVFSKLKKVRPDVTLSNLRPSPMPGLYKADLNGRMVFISKGGDFLISGEMYQVDDKYLVNLQEQDRQKEELAFAPKRAEMLAKVSGGDLVTYKAKGVTKSHIYVFTDIDCPFCRKFHKEIEEITDKGVEVRYLAFPRAGINSRSAQKLATIWCSDDKQELMTRYKRGKSVKLSVCDVNPVADQYMLAQEVGIRATPAIVLESGQLILGAVSPERLFKEMGLE